MEYRPNAIPIMDGELRGEYLEDAFSLSELVETCLYDPVFGYYTAGKVRWEGEAAHYQTFPQALSPSFGKLVARHAQQIFAALTSSQVLGRKELFYVVEIGPGDGRLANDFLTYAIRRSHKESSWRNFVRRLRYLLVDRAPQWAKWQDCLHRFQHWTRFVKADITNSLDPVLSQLRFTGMVFSNELLDNFPHERISIAGDGLYSSVYIALVDPEVLSRIGIPLQSKRTFEDPHKGTTVGRFRKYVRLRKEEFVDLQRALAAPKAQARLNDFHRHFNWAEFRVPIHHMRSPHWTADLLAEFKLPTNGPATAYVCPRYSDFFRAVGDMLVKGFVFTIDYGGTSNWLLSKHRAHMRVYGSRSGKRLRQPGEQDITFDVDFGALVGLGRRHGFDTVFLGPQRALADFVGVNLNLSIFKRRITEEQTATRLARLAAGEQWKDDREKPPLPSWTPFRKGLNALVTARILKEARQNRQSIKGIYAECKAEVEDWMKDFYHDPEHKLLIQVKGCEGVDLYG